MSGGAAMPECHDAARVAARVLVVKLGMQTWTPNEDHLCEFDFKGPVGLLGSNCHLP